MYALLLGTVRVETCECCLSIILTQESSLSFFLAFLNALAYLYDINMLLRYVLVDGFNFCRAEAVKRASGAHFAEEVCIPHLSSSLFCVLISILWIIL